MKSQKDSRIISNCKYDEDEDVCRICRNPGDSENPLKCPCACSGSIKFVHQECLLQWLNYSNARQCEICRYPFSFCPVYAESPSSLSIAKFVFGITTEGCHYAQYLMRLSFVLSVWLLIVPITFRIWRLAFARSFGEAREILILSRHISTTAQLVGFDGFLLPASILFVFLGASSCRDYFRLLRGLRGQEAAREDEYPVPFDDLVSMQLGSIFHFVKFVQVLSSIVKIISAVIFLPFSIGRIILRIMCWFSTTAIPVFCSRLSDATILAAGYMFVVSMVLMHLGIIAMVSYVKGEPWNVRRLYGITYIADAITSLVRQYTTIMRRLMSMFRLAFLLLVELGAFPLICGWWLDVCTFRMLGKAMSLMAEFSSFSPLASSLMHWTVGIVYMLQIGIYTFGICDVGSEKILTLKCILLSVNY
ncbi:hypothetical protein MKX03_019753 [Papaver bracteatum]|nr:hypothetical protein MKX03_019753 [Papaver bracteatum]